MRRTLFPLFLLATSPWASAQTSLLEIGNSDAANPWVPEFSSVESAGDVDGDGVRDLVISTLAKVTVFSGANGDVLHTFTEGASDIPGYLPYPLHGIAAFDVDGDQHDDIAVAGPLNPETGALDGAIRIYSGADGSVLRTLRQPHGHVLGFDGDRGDSGIDCGGDLDLDGFPDLVAVAPRRAFVPPDPAPGTTPRGVAFSGSDGSVLTLYQMSGLSSSPWVMLICSVGDVDLDGVPDVANRWDGRLALFRGNDGQQLYEVHTYPGQDPGSSFAFAVDCTIAGAGDLDIDGRADFAYTRGCVWGIQPTILCVRSGADAELLVRQQGLALVPRFANLHSGDFDGDGISDLVASEPDGGSNFAPISAGQVHVFVKGMQRRLAAPLQGVNAYSHFGTSLANIGDRDSDGADDLAVLEPGVDALAQDDAVHVLSLSGIEPEPFSFLPGFLFVWSQLTARLTTPDDIDQAEFEAVDGMRLIVRIDQIDPKLHAEITILDPDGKTVASWLPKAVKQKKVFKLNRHGTHRLVVHSSQGKTGSVRIATRETFSKPLVEYPPDPVFNSFYEVESGPIAFQMIGPKGMWVRGQFLPVSNVSSPIPITLRSIDAPQSFDLASMITQDPNSPYSELSFAALPASGHYALEIQPIDPAQNSKVYEYYSEFGIIFGNQYLEID